MTLEVGTPDMGPKTPEVLTPRKSVILYSGGMDSFIMWRMHEIDGVYFDIGGRYSEQEKALVGKVNGGFKTEHPITIEPLDFFGKDFEEPSGYIPYRNLIFMLKATMMGYDDVYFGMVAEWQRDKSKSFFNMTEGIAHDLGKKDLRIHAPYRGVSKSNVLKMYLEKGFPADDIYEYSRSCVSGTTGECGKCISCLSKYIALVNNGVYRPGYFEVEPKVDDFIQNRMNKFTTDFRWERIPSTLTRLKEAFDAKRKEKDLRR